ncbi:unnamed protein product [Spirodela intermedia]|uniref:Uncharacterized protein n=1 Tax=Spirodela intermedia TaxID=51605 RepID=A0A7I8KSF3_SPIIN|nr:unnamed protein product [Spirodela intermedia]
MRCSEKILSWVQTKINGKKEKKAFPSQSELPLSSPAQETGRKESFEEWPQGLLAIGTFGNHQTKKEIPKYKHSQKTSPLRDIPEFTQDEMERLERELENLLLLEPMEQRHEHNSSTLPPANCWKIADDWKGEEMGNLSPKAKTILRKARDVLMESQTNQKSQQAILLLRRMFVCSGGFTPAPGLRDPILASKKEKLLRTLVCKKIYPQSTGLAIMKFLEKRVVHSNKVGDKMTPTDKKKTEERSEDGSKWIKTDSEYIVLEI